MLNEANNYIQDESEMININEESELNRWSKEFKVSIEQLKEAIDSVGGFPGAVKYYLSK